MSTAKLNSLFGEPAQMQVERALTEFRSGRPVIIEIGKYQALVIGVEAIDDEVAAALQAIAGQEARLVLPAARLRRIGLDRTLPGSLAMPVIDAQRIAGLSLRLDAKVDAPVAPVHDVDRAALELAALSLTLPGVLVIPLRGEAPDAALRVSADAIMSFRSEAATDLEIVGRSPVPLEHAPKTEFVVFRGGEGLRDQVAVIVGNLDVSKPVSVRMHSACLTGDLFGSLKCDCGDQLRNTVRSMAEGDGGVLLYLDQEGRGNGIANKMRAYRLQSQGWDTYDADEALGFDLDQRHFDFAADMLKQLGITAVRLMTNNPVKIAALRTSGLKVVSDERVLGRPTVENVRYLASKRDRAGHFIDFESMAAHAPIQD